MIIGMHLGNGYGALPAAWRIPRLDHASYTDYDILPDRPSSVAADIDLEPPGFNLDVMVTLAAVAPATCASRTRVIASVLASLCIVRWLV